VSGPGADTARKQPVKTVRDSALRGKQVAARRKAEGIQRVEYQLRSYVTCTEAALRALKGLRKSSGDVPKSVERMS
jgi:hypothetical protein